MSAPAARERVMAAATVAALSLLLLSRLSTFGIWDPWELSVAEHARQLASGQAVEGASLSVRAASLGFRLFGTYEWAGRLPIALCALLTVVVTLVMVARQLGLRAGCYAAVILATTPAFVLNGRALAGAAPDFLLQTAVAWAGLEALVPNRPRLERWLWTAIAAASACLSALGLGVMVGPLPPLLGLAAACLFLDLGRDPERRSVATVLVAAAGGALASTVAAVVADSVESTPWTGGLPQGVAPATYDLMLERVLHAGAPWSALIPVAIGTIVAATTPPRFPSANEPGPLDGPGARALQVTAITWAAAGYAASTLYLARYGEAVTYVPLAALAVVVALFLQDVWTRPQARPGAAVAVLLLVGLLVRDYALFPESAIRGLSLAHFSLPKAFNPKNTWALLFGLFGVTAMLVLAVGDRRPQLRPRAPYQLLRSQWSSGWGHRAWLLALGTALAGLLTATLLTWLSPSALGFGVLGRKVLQRLSMAALALPVAVLALQAALWAAGRAGRLQVPAILVAGALFGAYAGHGFLPAVSGHLSPKHVYATYNRLAAEGEPLAEYGSDGRAAAYYVEGEVVAAKRTTDLVKHLTGEGRRWAAFPRDELGTINRLYRQRTREHLVVVDGHRGRMVLVCNREVAGVVNRNFFAQTVLRAAPAMQHAVNAVFDDSIELLGYDLELPHDGYVGAGESFWITWIFRVKRRMTKSPKVFVHVDSASQRIHGDHEPLEGKLPMRLWETGDVVIDRHRLEVQANQRAGTYTVYVGLYSGETRVPVSQGPADESNRVKAGVLRIR